jgi:hypothetical protein
MLGKGQFNASWHANERGFSGFPAAIVHMKPACGFRYSDIQGCARMKNIGERLKDHFVAAGAAVRPGVAPAKLATFEARNRVCLPVDFRDYFLAFDGTGRYQSIGWSMFSFWSLDELQKLKEEWPEWPEISNLKESEAFYLFADSALSCPAYAIRLSPDITQPNPIFQILSDDLEFEVDKAADSFTEFVERFMAHGIV